MRLTGTTKSFSRFNAENAYYSNFLLSLQIECRKNDLKRFCSTYFKNLNKYIILSALYLAYALSMNFKMKFKCHFIVCI